MSKIPPPRSSGLRPPSGQLQLRPAQTSSLRAPIPHRLPLLGQPSTTEPQERPSGTKITTSTTFKKNPDGTVTKTVETTKKTVTKRPPSSGYGRSTTKEIITPGRYIIPMRESPGDLVKGHVYSSPYTLREEMKIGMALDMPEDLVAYANFPKKGESQQTGPFRRKHPQYQSGNIVIEQLSPEERQRYRLSTQQDLNINITPEPGVYTPVSRTEQTLVHSPKILTPEGAVALANQIRVEQILERSPQSEQVTKRETKIENVCPSCDTALKTETVTTEKHTTKSSLRGITTGLQKHRTASRSPPYSLPQSEAVPGSSQRYLISPPPRTSSRTSPQRHVDPAQVYFPERQTPPQMPPRFLSTDQAMSLSPRKSRSPNKSSPSREKISIVDEVLENLEGRRSTSRHVIVEREFDTDLQDLSEQLPDPVLIQQLVEEENEDFERSMKLIPVDVQVHDTSTYTLRKNICKERIKTPSRVTVTEYPPITADEEAEEMPPEVAAAVMYTEELGYTMDSTPTNLYGYLFPGRKDDPLIGISVAAPAEPLKDIVVPLTIPAELHKSVQGHEIQQAAAAAQTLSIRPQDNIFAESVVKDREEPFINDISSRLPSPSAKKYTSTPRKKTTFEEQQLQESILEHESLPSDFFSVSPIVIDLVGAAPSNIIATEPHSSKEITNSLDYILTPEPPRHFSRIQLRGTQRPSWFPGFYMALPDFADIKIERSPSAVLRRAWNAVKPASYKEDSILVT